MAGNQKIISFHSFAIVSQLRNNTSHYWNTGLSHPYSFHTCCVLQQQKQSTNVISAWSRKDILRQTNRLPSNIVYKSINNDLIWSQLVLLARKVRKARVTLLIPDVQLHSNLPLVLLYSGGVNLCVVLSVVMDSALTPWLWFASLYSIPAVKIWIGSSRTNVLALLLHLDSTYHI